MPGIEGYRAKAKYGYFSYFMKKNLLAIATRYKSVYLFTETTKWSSCAPRGERLAEESKAALSGNYNRVGELDPSENSASDLQVFSNFSVRTKLTVFQV